MATVIWPATRRSFAYERIASVTTGAAVPLTVATYSNLGQVSDARVAARGAIITVEANDVRYTTDGTTPTTGASGHGHRAKVDTTIILEGLAEIKNFKAIGESATGTLIVTYLR